MVEGARGVGLAMVRMPRMKIRLLPSIVSLSILSQGCSPLYNVSRTIIAEPLAYNDTAAKMVELDRDYKRAKEAWAVIQKANPDHDFSEDYVCGFEEGYTDFLYAGP